jgi:hypothetical protein
MFYSLFFFSLVNARQHQDCEFMDIENRLVERIAWHPNGRIVAIADTGGAVDGCILETRLRIMDTISQNILFEKIEGNYTSRITDISWKSDGTELLFGDISGAITRIHTQTFQIIYVQNISSVSITRVSWHPDGTRFAVSSFNNETKIFSEDNNLIYSFDFGIGQYPGLDSGVFWNGYSPNGMFLGIASFNGFFGVYSAVDHSILYSLNLVDDPIVLAFWSPDSSKIATSRSSGTIQIRDSSNGDVILDLQSALPNETLLNWSPDGSLIAGIDPNGFIIIWNALSGNQNKTISDEYAISSLSWSANGQLLYGGRQIFTIDDNGIYTEPDTLGIEILNATAFPHFTSLHSLISALITIPMTPAPAVQLVDAAGAPLAQAGVPVTVALNAADANPVGTLSGTLTQLTDASGVATFPDLSIDAPGLKTLTFAAPDMPALVSDPFLVYTPGTLDVTHTDPAAGLTLTDEGLFLAEGATIGDQFAVRLSAAPDAAVTVSLAAPSDVTFSPSALTFMPANYNAWQVVNVAAAEDNTAEAAWDAPEVLPVTLTASGDPRYDGVTAALNADVYDAGLHIVPSPLNDYNLTLPEGGTGSYRARLTAPPGVRAIGVGAETVTVRLQGYNGMLTSPTPTRLAFTRANWNIQQMVMVTARDDSNNYGVSYLMSILNAFTSDVVAPLDSRYGGATPNLAAVRFRIRVLDND